MSFFQEAWTPASLHTSIDFNWLIPNVFVLKNEPTCVIIESDVKTIEPGHKSIGI